MQDIYNYVHETDHVFRVQIFTAFRWLQLTVMLFSVINFLYFYISTFRSMCTVQNMAVFLRFLISCFRGMLLKCVLNDFEMVPVARIIIIIIITLLPPITANRFKVLMAVSLAET